MSSQEIVKIIEEELKRKSISKAQFYNDVGIKAGHMSNWRKGSNYPSVKMMIKISEYLGLDLMAQTEKPATSDGDGENDVADAKIKRLLNLFESFDPDEQDRALAILELFPHRQDTPGESAPKAE